MPADPPADFDQRVSSTAPLKLITTWEYHDVYGLHKVVYPNGRETHIVYVDDLDDPMALEIWEYRDVTDIDGGTCRLLSPIRVTHVAAGQPTTVKEVAIETVNYPPAGGESYSDEDVIATSTPQYGLSGELTGMSTDSGDDTLSAYISYHSAGLVSREVAPDGTITRYTYDLLGRPWRTYRGTTDTHSAWGTAGTDPTDWDDDMVLVEKRYYGTGVTDANELVELREYRDKPDNQYQLWDPHADPPDGEPGSGWWQDDVVPNEDEIGWSTTYEYDWRMRPVWSTEYDADGAVLRHTASWLDNLGREVISATYGPYLSYDDVVPNDPRELGIDADPAGAGFVDAILSDEHAPLALTQNVYNARGLVEETRNYRPDDGDYTATVTYYNHADQPVQVCAPNSAKQEYIYDAKGRQVNSSTVPTDNTGNDVIVASATTTYDANDRAIVSAHTEYDEAGVNDITSYVYTWYDDAGRVSVTANYGTNTSDNTYSPGLELPDHAGGPPAIGTDGVLVTEYGYDDAGRQNLVVSPDGTETRTAYDGLGRVLLVVEDAGNADGDGIFRRTAYNYDSQGRLTDIAAVPPSVTTVPAVNEIDSGEDLAPLFDGSPPAGVQVTSLEYNAVIYPADWWMEPYSDGWSPRTGEPGDPGTWGGESASQSWVSRVTYPDGNYLEFAYYSDGAVAMRTDSRGNVLYYAYDELGRLTEAWIDDRAYYATAGAWEPVNRVQNVSYTYTDEGAIDTVTALTGSGDEIAYNDFGYDTADNLATEFQRHLGATPRIIGYVWDYAPFGAGNYNRLTNIYYPGAGCALTCDYGDGVSSSLNRIVGISEAGCGALAAYDYFGAHRRVGVIQGNGVNRSFGTPGDFVDLDRFGRVQELAFDRTGEPAFHSYSYTYDSVGNRLTAIIDQVNDTNDHAYTYEYDRLNRLVSADRNGATVAATTQDWILDDLGNWAGTGTGGMERHLYLSDTDFLTHEVWHDTDLANEITGVRVRLNGETWPTETTYVHDLAGNLVFDGAYLYQYDGFNRLVQVNEAAGLDGTPDTGDFDAAGSLIDDSNLGAKVAAFVYDGLGRLIRAERLDAAGNGQVEDYYYDGVRRVQEVCETTPAGMPERRATREYVWGPGYVDEVVCQVDRGGADPPADPGVADLYYYLQDANYNVVALLDENANVLVQYTYDPYGNLAAIDVDPDGVLAGNDPPHNAIAHQGLFFERFFGVAADLLSDASLAPADVLTGDGPSGLYHNRNRWYGPDLGRFISRDPNESALPIVVALTRNGQSWDILLGAFDANAHYADGLNLYLYLGGNPINGLDPSGLQSIALGGGMAGSLVLGFQLAVTQMALSGASQVLAIAGMMLGHAYITSMQIMAAGSSWAGSVDPGYYSMMADEFGRFQEWTSNHAASIHDAFESWINSPTAANSNWPDGWDRFNHTLDKAAQWFGVRNQDCLTPTQLADWARNCEWVARSSRFVQQTWRGQDTIVKWAQIDGKYLALRFDVQERLITAMIYTHPQQWMY